MNVFMENMNVIQLFILLIYLLLIFFMEGNCHLNFPHIQLKSHYLECPEIEINCVKCKQKFLRKNKNNHSDIQCLENRYSAIMRDNLDLKKEVNQLKTKVKDLEEIINNLKNNEKNKN